MCRRHVEKECVFLLSGRYASSTVREASMGSWYCHCKVFCSLIICNLRKIVKNSIQGPSLFKRISSGITAFLFILCVLVFYTLYKIVSFLDSVVKLYLPIKICI